MIAPRTLIRLALVASLTIVAGCGSSNPDVDDAVTIPNAPATKDAPAPATSPAKEAPKG